MIQTNLDNWEVVSSQINTRKRINWVEHLGTTLTEKITEYRLQELSSDNIYKLIKSELLKKGFDESDVFRRLKISVAARCGEQNAHKNRINKARYK